jgi:cytochrome c oxidase cbb3-type subunit I/II
MINGLLTLRGVWHLLRTDPIVKFLVAAITFYGMSTFEGPLMSIKSVSSLAHYTDWVVGHAHSGALGWNGFMSFALIYFLVPKLWNTEIFSKKLMNYHFWLGLLGIVIYYTSMVIAGVTQGLMWRAVDASGRLVYPDFVETVTRIVPLYGVRAFGGFLFLAGFILLLYNIWKTISLAPKNAAVETYKALPMSAQAQDSHAGGHRKLEGMGFVFTALVVVAILVGSVLEILPTLSIHKYVPQNVTTTPYSPLELAGRDVYIKEGCYVCHSQMIRKMESEVLRYGPASTIAESMYDRPFQWGSKRSGPDLARVGGKYPDLWHYRHMLNPRDINQNSIMPVYDWLERKKINMDILSKKVGVMKALGVPYSDEEVKNAAGLAKAQAEQVAAAIEKPELANTELVALIAYLQSLGKQTKGQ